MRRRVLLSLGMWLALMVMAALILLLTAEVVCPALDGVEVMRKACGEDPGRRMTTLYIVMAVVMAILVAVRPPSERT